MNNTSNETNTHNGHPFVDLGLPSGLLWATSNVGADSPEQTGLYFAWGETEGFTAEQIKAGERYFEYKTSNIRSFKHNLTLERDAAHACMGGKWRMPTREEIQELIDNCTTKFILNHNGTGVKGFLFTSKTNGKSIFFPATGNSDDCLVLLAGYLGNYWTATLASETSSHSLCLFGTAKGVSDYEWFLGTDSEGRM